MSTIQDTQGHAEPARLLLVEDNPGDVRLIREMIKANPAPFELIHVDRLALALQRLEEKEIDATLLDLSLPDSQGLDTLVQLRAHVWRMPVVVLTGFEDERLGMQLVQAGAQDYLVKGQVSGPLLARAIRYAIERKRVEEALQAERDFAMQVLNAMGQGLTVTNAEGRFEYVNPAYARMVGRTPDELMGMRPKDVTVLDDHALLSQERAHRQAGEISTYETRLRHVENKVVPVMITGVPRWRSGKVEGAISVITDLTENKRAEEALRDKEYLLSESQRIGHIGSWGVDLATNNVTWTDETYRLYGVSPDTFVPTAESLNSLLHPDDRGAMKEWMMAAAAGEKLNALEFRAVLPDGLIRTLSGRGEMIYADGHQPVRIIGTVQDITERKQAEEQLREHSARVEALARVAARLNAQLDLDAVLNTVCEEAARALNARATSVTLYDAGRDVLDLAATLGLPPEYRHGHLPIPRATYDQYVAQMGPLIVVPDVQTTALRDVALYVRNDIRTIVTASMIRDNQLVGGLNLYTIGESRTFTDGELELLKGLADQAAQAIVNARLHDQVQKRRAELVSLYDLSRALADESDFNAILDLIVRRAVETVRTTFARLALIEEDALVVRAAFPIRVLDRDFQIGYREPIAAHPYCAGVLEQNAPVVIRADYSEIGAAERAMLLLDWAKTLCLVPLQVDKRAVGLLMLGEMRSEEREPFTPEKIHLARNIGDQASSALRRAELFGELERAYLQTVLALASAVDAKDNYTANHSLQLAQMALAVGRESGISEDELEDLRYGATLHDVGKIGVPDAVLKKPSKLNDDEWKLMREHPRIGARILAAVPRLARAAKIVQHHHERFDGKGYPDGIAGEAIPLGARILTVVDSYRAIVDARVYKAAQSPEEAIAELKRCSGTQFDPRVVETFLQLLARNAWDANPDR